MENDGIFKIGKVRKIVDWFFAVVFMLGSFGYMNTSISSILGAILLFIVGVALLPIRKILSLWYRVCGENRRYVRPLCIVIAIVIVSFLVPKTESSSTAVKDSETTSVSVESEENTDSKPANEIEELLGKTGYDNFLEAADEINLKVEDISDFEQIDDWASGNRYSFTYKGTGFTLYMLANDYVSGINSGSSHIYEDGYESRNIDDYISDSGMMSQLRIESEELVKQQLNHPNTADFHWVTTGTYGCANNVYSLTCDVDAKNSFGVEDTLTFTTQFKVSGTSYQLVYFVLDGTVISGSRIDENAGRATAESKLKEAATSQNSIILTEGQQGEYGKPLDNDPTIFLYYIPAGTYTVKAITPGMAFVSVPHDDNDCATYTFSSVGETQTIEVPEGQVVQLMVNTSLEFIPQ